MNSQQILQLVKERSDVRFGETIERLFFILLSRHAHQCWLKECDCEYCRFITGKYVDEKLILHKLKKRIRMLDNNYWNSSDYELQLLWQLQEDQFKQKTKIRLLKDHKKELQGNIL